MPNSLLLIQERIRGFLYLATAAILVMAVDVGQVVLIPLRDRATRLAKGVLPVPTVAAPSE